MFVTHFYTLTCFIGVHSVSAPDNCGRIHGQLLLPLWGQFHHPLAQSAPRDPPVGVVRANNQGRKSLHLQEIKAQFRCSHAVQSSGKSRNHTHPLVPHAVWLAQVQTLNGFLGFVVQWRHWFVTPGAAEKFPEPNLATTGNHYDYNI